MYGVASKDITAPCGQSVSMSALHLWTVLCIRSQGVANSFVTTNSPHRGSPVDILHYPFSWSWSWRAVFVDKHTVSLPFVDLYVRTTTQQQRRRAAGCWQYDARIACRIDASHPRIQKCEHQVQVERALLIYRLHKAGARTDIQEILSLVLWAQTNHIIELFEVFLQRGKRPLTTILF